MVAERAAEHGVELLRQQALRPRELDERPEERLGISPPPRPHQRLDEPRRAEKEAPFAAWQAVVGEVTVDRRPVPQAALDRRERAQEPRVGAGDGLITDARLRIDDARL